MTDHANNGAATSAGYTRIQYDRGAGKSPRYVSRYEKPMIGEPGASGFLFCAEGHSDVDQATADTNALAALNKQRAIRYGSGSVAGTGSRGGALTFDLH